MRKGAELDSGAGTTPVEVTVLELTAGLDDAPTAGLEDEDTRPDWKGELLETGAVPLVNGAELVSGAGTTPVDAAPTTLED